MQCSMIDLHNHYIAFEAIDSTVGLMEQNGSGEGRTPVQTFPIIDEPSKAALTYLCGAGVNHLTQLCNWTFKLLEWSYLKIPDKLRQLSEYFQRLLFWLILRLA